MEIKVQYPEEDEVKGPKELQTEEQVRTRQFQVKQEGDTERALRTDPNLSTLRQNLNGAGVDDRRDDSRPDSDYSFISGQELRVLPLPLLDRP